MQGLLVLVVDDMRSMRAIVKGVLQSMGIDALIDANDGRGAGGPAWTEGGSGNL